MESMQSMRNLHFLRSPNIAKSAARTLRRTLIDESRDRRQAPV
jgi:hypothetical protein